MTATLTDRGNHSRGSNGPLPADVRVAVIGAGFAGLGTAIKLKQDGIHDFVLLERGDDIGGTWRDNSYPGCACDIPSNLYSFSFALNPNWSRAFSPQPEIQSYLQRCTDDFNLRPHIYLGADVLEARWDEGRKRWRIRTARGELTARVLIAAQGPLSAPSTPDLPGLADFAGVAFHTATWRHDVDLTGKRVAIIGTGSSSIQLLPFVQKQAAHLTLFQRTAPWVVPRRDRAIKPWQQQVYRRIPLAQKAVRAGLYVGHELMVPAFTGNERASALFEKRARQHLAQQVADPELRAKLTPHFRFGCKRVLISNDYYPALCQPNVDVATNSITEVVPEGIATLGADGERVIHPVDVIIFGTGFHVTDSPLPRQLIGKDGRTLQERWADDGGVSALHGTTVAGFPNLFLLVGPNTGLGHNSIIFMIESQLSYLLDALHTMQERRATTIEPLTQVQQAYNMEIQHQLAGTVWNSGGCTSWYLDEHGRNTSLWPTFTFRYRQLMRRFDPTDYELGQAPGDDTGLGSARELSATG